MRINIKKSLFWGGSLLSGIGGNVSGALLLTLNQAPVLVVLSSDSSKSPSDSSDSSSDSSDSSDASSETECNFNESGSGSKCYVENERGGYKLKVEILDQDLIEKIKNEVKRVKDWYWPGYTDEKGLVWCIGAYLLWHNGYSGTFWRICGNKWSRWSWNLHFPDELSSALRKDGQKYTIDEKKIKVTQLTK